MRVCMIASTYPRFNEDGSGRFNRSLAEALASLGHNVHVLVPYDIHIRSYSTPVHLHFFRYIWPPRWGIMGFGQAMNSDRRLKKMAYLQVIPFLISGGISLRTLVKRYHCDVIHAHWVLPNGPAGFFASATTGTPLFISLHGSDMFIAQKSALFAAISRIIFRHARGVAARSMDLYNGAIALGASAHSVYLIPGGADPTIFAAPPDLSHIRGRLGLSEDTAVILAIGRLVGKKGFNVLIKAMAYIMHRQPHVRCVIVGDGPELPYLREIAAKLHVSSHCIFTGAVPWDQIPSYLHLADIFIAPSIHDEGNVDGLPSVILEAMAAGKPVIASRVAGIPLAVLDGETGILVPEQDAVALAHAIEYLLQNPELRLRFGQAGRQRIVNELNWKTIARRWVAIYQSGMD